MGYYLRFLATDDTDINLSRIHSALQKVDESYEVSVDEGAKGESGELFWSGGLYAELEINRPGDDGLFEEEIQELKELIEDSDAPARASVLATLTATKCTVAARVLWHGRDPEATLAKLDPLWQWLFQHSTGLLQADGEGYYDADGLVLEEGP